MLDRIETAFRDRYRQCGFPFSDTELRLHDPDGNVPVEVVPPDEPLDRNRHFTVHNPAGIERVLLKIDHWLYAPGPPRRCDCGIISAPERLHLIEFKQGNQQRQSTRLDDAAEQVKQNVEAFLANGVLTGTCEVDAHAHVGYPLTPYPINRVLILAKELANHFDGRLYVAFTVGTELTLS